MTQTQQEQWDFLADVFLSNSLSGGLGHSGTYVKTKNKGEEKWLNEGKEKLYGVLKAALCELTAKYSTGASVTTEEHMESLQRLKQCAKDSCAESLRGGELRLGVVAKLLNLFLKFFWCVGKITTPPPHCPFDRRLIQERLGFTGDDWTKVDDPATYLKWVSKAEELRDKENRGSLAEWELYAWGGKAGCPHAE
jgi:hypothetical protein